MKFIEKMNIIKYSINPLKPLKIHIIKEIMERIYFYGLPVIYTYSRGIIEAVDDDKKGVLLKFYKFFKSINLGEIPIILG